MIYLKILLGLATVAIVLYNIATSIQKTASPYLKNSIYEDSEHHITSLKKDSAIIEWKSQEKELGSVEYGIIKDTYYKSRSDTEATHSHSIKLDFLQECTTYYYHVSSASMLFEKEDAHFNTLCNNVTD